MNDSMPHETATEMLLTEKRLGAPMRKQCERARWRVYSSAVPLLRNADGSYAQRPTADCRSAESKRAEKLGHALMRQLYAWLKRARKRRLMVQRTWEALKAKPSFPKQDDFLKALEAKAADLDTIADAYEAEINRRTTRQ